MNTAGTGLAKISLIGLMAVGSVFLWIGIPVGWLWIGSQMQSDSGQASFGLYFGVLAGIIVSMSSSATFIRTPTSTPTSATTQFATCRTVFDRPART